MSTTSNDHLSYQRAIGVSLIGLAVQFVLGVTLLVYGVVGSDPGAVSGAVAILLGILIWVALALVFNQHRLERLEAMEVEAYESSDAAQSSVFEDVGADQAVQLARLNWMHRWLLPAVSILAGLAFALVGFVFLRGDRVAVSIEGFDLPDLHGWAIAIGVGVAVIGFILARFVAGMAKQPVWVLLHGGAGAAVGAALIGVTLAIAHFLFVALGSDWLLRVFPWVVDVYMMLVGLEIFVNFLLNLYRPRKPGEYLRPAFDSRILAFVAAPDRLAESISGAINYQFGFNVSSTWFYRLLSRWIAAILVVGVLVVWSMTSFAIVRPDERGLLIRSGEVARELEPGLAWKRPWPFDRVVTFTASALNEIVIGTRKDLDEPLLWTKPDEAGEDFMIVQPTRLADEDERRDVSLLSVEMPVHYVVDDLQAYYMLAQNGPSDDPEQIRRELLTAIASEAALELIARYSVDDVLGARHEQIAAELRAAVQRAYDEVESGAKVVFAGIVGAHPSSDAARAFERVVAADQLKQATIENARAERIRVLSQVAGDIETAARMTELLDELDALKARLAGDDDADADEPPADREALAAEIAETERELLDLIIDSGGQAAQSIAQARTDRWERHMGERAAAIRVQGLSASYAAAPQLVRVDLYLDALREVSAEARVFVVPAGADVRLDETEVGDDYGFSTAEEQAEQE